MNENKKIKLMIGIPTASALLHRKFVQSLMSLRYPPNIDVDINICEGFQLPFARNRIVQNALEMNADYLFWLDADMIFPSDSLQRLFDRKVDICHALSFRRISPHYPCLFAWNSDTNAYETIDYSLNKSDMINVDAAGSACTLINIDVYKKMKTPYYYYESHFFSSDLTFSMNAKKLGYAIYVDRTLKIGHIGEEVVITEDFYLSNLSKHSKEDWNNNMKKALKHKELY